MINLNKAKSIVLMIFIFFISGCANSQKKENKSKNDHKFTNQLIDESSPYLLQHAHNPVNWMPWGNAAFEKAKKENKLVIISIGYSSCHWCHVMEHESFENESVAKLMNDYFVCIKVDREERPDVDQIYMTAVQLMTGSGGWPLNCFTLPDGSPVYGGTYFNREQWVKVMEDLQNTYKKDPQRLIDYADNLSNGIQQSELIKKVENPSTISIVKLNEMNKVWLSDFDLKNGGMKRAPKFPIPNNYDYLMQYAYHTKDSIVMNQVDLTLTQMASGGIYDQIGGGFARYSTDEKWKVPHFEKMLYDNAQLVSLYSKAFQRTKNPLYKKIVFQTLSWVEREMTTKLGSFYSALDADSEGEEGKYYVWTKSELKTVLSEQEFQFLKSYYELNQKGLWEGNYIMLKDPQKTFDINDEDEIKKINTKLLTKRNERVRPGLDDKSLTSWNSLMLIAYIDAYIAFNNETFLNQALSNAKWLRKKQIQSDGKLYHTFKNGKSKIDGFLDDYAFTIQAFIKLYEVTFNEEWLDLSNELTQYVNEHFEDESSGMYYFTSDESQVLIARKMEINDNVIPSSNSQMANNLYKLGMLLDNKIYIKKSKQMLLNVYDQMHTYPSAYSNWSILALNMIKPYYQIAITGSEWQEKLINFGEYYVPNTFYMGGTKSQLIMLEGKFLGETTIFVCQFGACKMPVNSVKKAIGQLE